MIGRHVRTHAGVFGAIFRDRATLAEEAAITAAPYQLLDYVGVAARANDLAKHLAYGDQRRLEIARALATDPKLLALDEPAAGMNATETQALKRLLEDIRRDGTTILLIEHDMKLVMSVCDRVLVLDYGRKIAEGSAADVQKDPEGDRCLPGRRGLAARQGCPLMAAPALLELTKLEVAYGGIHAVKGIDLIVRQGELVCLIGANGAGKTTTLKGITGLQPVKAGKIVYDGTDVTGKPAFQLVRKGLSMVPEGRGVFGALTIEENLAMGAYSRRDRNDIKQDVERVFGLFPRLKERRKQTAGTLSGGEQQMLAMARAIMSRPKLLLLDEPSMGLAPLMVQKVFETVLAIAAEGVTILLIEQNAKLALEVSHRGYVMESGTITLSGDARRAAVGSEGARGLSRRVGLGPARARGDATPDAGRPTMTCNANFRRRIAGVRLRRSQRGDDLECAGRSRSPPRRRPTRPARPAGPTRAHAIIASTAGAGPLTSASTRPSRRLRTQPPSPRTRASSANA